MHIRSYFIASAYCIAIGQLSASMVRITNESNYKNVIASSHKPMLVEFAAEWCSVCTGIQKPLEEVANDPEFAHVEFVQVDVDKCDGLCKERGIVGVPTFVYMHEGKEKIKETGVQKIEDFSTHVRGNLRQHFNMAQNTSSANIMNQAPAIQEEVIVTETEQPAPEQGTLARIMALIISSISSLIMTLKNAIMGIIGAIKGFFNT